MVNMSRGLAICATAFFAGVALAPSAHAATTVNCAKTDLSAAIATAIASATPGETLALSVSGTCKTHLFIPLSINLVLTGVGAGTYGATITATDSNTVIAISGRLILNNISVTTTGTPDAVIQVNAAGNGQVNNSSVYADNSMALFAPDLGYISVYNSEITGGGNGALEIYGGSDANIYAAAGGHTTIKYVSTGGTEAIGCYDSSIGVGTSGSGTVTVGPSTGADMFTRGCTATIGGSASSNSIRFTGGTYGGIYLDEGGSVFIRNSTFDSIPGAAINNTAGTVRIINTKISVPTNGVGLQANRGGIIYFDDQASTVSGVAFPYSCYQNGHVYADTAPLGGGKSNGCLTVGGAYQN